MIVNHELVFNKSSKNPATNPIRSDRILVSEFDGTYSWAKTNLYY